MVPMQTPTASLPVRFPLPFITLGAARDFFAETSLSGLVFLAIVFLYVGQAAAALSPHARCGDWARRLGYAAFLLFALHEYATTRPIGDEELLHLVSIGFHAFLTLIIVQGAAATALGVITRTRWEISKSLRSLRQRLAKPPAPPPPSQPSPMAEPPAPDVDRAEALKASIDQLKREYEAELQALGSAGLDGTELGEAFFFARQKYVRRLHEITRR